MKAVLLISHGSHSPKTKQEVQSLVESLKGKSSATILEFSFLEIEKPNIPEGIEMCVKQGASEIVLLLNFLNAGKHVDEDIPRITMEAQQRHPSIRFRITKPVGQHPKIQDLFIDLISNPKS